MDIKAQLLEDFKQAVKEKNLLKKEVIQVCRAAIKQVEVDKRIELTEEEMLDVLNKEWKKKQDALQMVGSSRPDFAEKLKQEMEVIATYLPAKMRPEEVEAFIRQEVDKLGFTSMKDMGALMKHLMPLLKDKADGRLISESIKKILS